MFEVGDIVEWSGVTGKVTIRNDDLRYITVQFGDERVTFELDGRLYDWLKKPQLELVQKGIKRMWLSKTPESSFVYESSNGLQVARARQMREVTHVEPVDLENWIEITHEVT